MWVGGLFAGPYFLRLSQEASLKKTVVASLAALFLLFAAWASTGLTVRWDPDPAAAPVPETATPPAPPLTAIDVADPPPSKIDYARLDSRLQRLIAEDNMVGLAVAIVEDGQIRFMKGYGETVAGSGDPVTTGTIFRWASVSKGVAADMVAKLAHQGKLSLHEPVARHAPSMRLPAGNEHKATVADLLSHTLGIWAHAYDLKLEEGGDARALRSQLATLNNICSPGQCHAYQNVAYDAASEIVEQVTGEPYPQVVRERLFLPLGMTSATATRDGLVNAPSWAQPHRGGKNSKPVEVTDSYYRVPAAGGVNSSIKDLALWMRAQMGLKPQVLPPEVLAEVQMPRASTVGELRRKREFRERIKDADYGLGWRIYDYAGRTVIGHRGGVTGYRSLIMFDPELKSGVVALWNSGTNQPGGLEMEVMDMIYGLEPRDWLELEEMGQPLDDQSVTDAGN